MFHLRFDAEVPGALPIVLTHGWPGSFLELTALARGLAAPSRRGGDLSRRFSDDFILTHASLYWFTNAISTSFRPYYEHPHGMTPRMRKVDVPTAVAVFPKDLSHPRAAGPSAATISPGAILVPEVHDWFVTLAR